MPDTKRTRNTKELRYTEAVERLMNLAADSDVELEREHDKAHTRVVLKYRAKFAAVLARVPEKVRAAVAADAGIKMPPEMMEPDLNAAPDALAAEGPPDDAEPVYTAAGVQEPLTAERKKIAGMK